MELNRNVSLASALRYKGQGPMLTYVLHRIGGLGMAIFITVHILASFHGRKDRSFRQLHLRELDLPDLYFLLRAFPCHQRPAHHHPGPVAELIEYQREAIWVEWAVFLPLYGFAVLVIVQTAMGG